MSASIDDGFKKNAFELKKLDDSTFTANVKILHHLLVIKDSKKQELTDYLKEAQDIDIDSKSVFDIQVERLHECKRQQMNALYLIHKYLGVKRGSRPTTPITTIFRAKAAPAYTIAKDITHMIPCLRQVIDNDPDVRPWLNMVMVNSYNMNLTEKLVPACDISEQISLISKEASGTGNMKFMLNGATIPGTGDGADVEIHELANNGSIHIFDESGETVIRRYVEGSCCFRSYYGADPDLRETIDFVINPTMAAAGSREYLERLHSKLLNRDWFVTFPDFKDYCRTREQALSDYENRTAWAREMLTNINKAGCFSSDRIIEEYNRDIWKLGTGLVP